MEERLYHGKRTDNGEWVEGYYVKAKWYLDEREMHVIFPDDLVLFPHSEFSEYYEVVPGSVGQYTGWVDKNHKKIFEGNIVKFSSSDYMGFCESGVVVFKDGCYGIEYITEWERKREHIFRKPEPTFHRIGEIDEWQEMSASGTITYAYEVIGDIHDKPEPL